MTIKSYGMNGYFLSNLKMFEVISQTAERSPIIVHTLPSDDLVKLGEEKERLERIGYNNVEIRVSEYYGRHI